MVLIYDPNSRRCGPGKRALDVFEFLKSHQAEHGETPTLRQIADAVGLKSGSSVWQHLRALEKHGLLVIPNRKRRGGEA